MRAELFVKDATSLLSQSRLLYGFGATGINLPNKARMDAPLASLQALASGVLTPSQLSEVCPHYSIKFNSERAAEASLARFESFCESSAALGIRRLLLVSGSGSRTFDTIACLRAMRLPAAHCPGIGVAFNPFFPERTDRERERARLRLKLGTGRVSSVWLQLGSDVALLEEGLSFLRTLALERQLSIELFGSVFLPSKRLLAQMRFRPWNGVFLSEEYLESVAAAEAITARVLRLYRAHGVEVLVETAVRTKAEWMAAERLLAAAQDVPPLPVGGAAGGAAGGGTHESEGVDKFVISCDEDAAGSEADLPDAHAHDCKGTAAAADARVAPYEGASSADDERAPPSKRLRPTALRAYVGCLPEVPTVPAVPLAATTCADNAGKQVSICWYRAHDLRIADHNALRAASAHAAVVPAFVWAVRRGEWAPGGAAQAWLRHALVALHDGLRERYQSQLVLRLARPVTSADEADEADEVSASVLASLASSSGTPPSPSDMAAIATAKAAAAMLLESRRDGGPPFAVATLDEAVDTASELLRLVHECGASSVQWSRSYEPEGGLVEAVVARALALEGVSSTAHAGHLLYEPAAIRLPPGFSGGHWGTLMPFIKACERSGSPPARPLPPPAQLVPPPAWPPSETLAALQLAAPPTRSDGSAGADWGASIIATGEWAVNEEEAHRQMALFVEGAGLREYESQRSRADESGTVSRLSPYLRFGMLSPRHLYHAVRELRLEHEVTKTFARRLHWRDLASFQLHCFPDMSTVPIRRHYETHAWTEDASALRAWRRGTTGFPMVDSGMRCLYATGWMHQSVRMVVASFLVEYLGISWVEGARWFHHTLVDADVAINAMMWQNAGRSGIDQWNFVLSPTTGSQDPTGAFCRRWLPELAQLPTKYLHEPWRATPAVLASAGVELGRTYPERIIKDLEGARRASVSALLETRAAHLEWNDADGYDLIRLPDGELSRVFTKQEFRLTGAGKSKPPPAVAAGAAQSGRRGGDGRAAGRGGGRGTDRGRGTSRGGRGRSPRAAPPAGIAQPGITAYFQQD